MTLRGFFPAQTAKRFPTSLNYQHGEVGVALGLSLDFVLHSLRHTFLPRLGEAGVEAFTIMRIGGHSTITVSQEYVDPSIESMERAFERLALFDRGKGPKTTGPRYRIRYDGRASVRSFLSKL